MAEPALLAPRPATRQALGEDVAESLREAIFRGPFKPRRRPAAG